MSQELIDYRGRITPETDCVLEARTRATGKDRQEIAREVLHHWALEEIHAATVMQQQLDAKGISGSGAGTRGKTRE